jgi:hypothetical protein
MIMCLFNEPKELEDSQSDSTLQETQECSSVITDEHTFIIETGEYNVDEYMPLYSSVPRNIKVNSSVMSNQRIYSSVIGNRGI